jgi:hypothetical protein
VTIERKAIVFLASIQLIYQAPNIFAFKHQMMKYLVDHTQKEKKWEKKDVV